MPLLLGLNKEGLTVADRAEDVRGYRVSDKDGNDIGEVDELIVEDGKHIVRFLRVAVGGFLGLGEAKFLVPADAITSIDKSPDHTTVHIDRTCEHVAGGPPYDPTSSKATRLKATSGRLHIVDSAGALLSAVARAMEM